MVSSLPEIHHVALQTGQTNRFGGGKFSPELLTLVVSWLRQGMAARSPTPLPGDRLSHYSGKVRAGGQSEALLVHLFAPGGPHLKATRQYDGLIPLVTLGVVRLPQHGQRLWEMMCEQGGTLHPGVQKPPEPWLATNIHPSMIHDLDNAGRLTEFEEAVAWAWLAQCRA